ncbi:unnamed protein product [marine sediment metagenome]|uniref:Uncharacterized protein n=1 Tax=marine sediment metagenome TaxID=412755 RepID=X1LL20_9ZZZZ
MVDFEKVFEPDETIGEEDKLFKAVKELSGKIGESTGTSTFITVEDALNSGSDILLIKNETSEDSPVERNFIDA